jgi:hypothetical protein
MRIAKHYNTDMGGKQKPRYHYGDGASMLIETNLDLRFVSKPMSSLANFYLTQSGALRKNVKLFTLGSELQPPPYPTHKQLYELFSLFIDLVNSEGRTFERNFRKDGEAITLEMRGSKKGAKEVQMEYTFLNAAAAAAFVVYFDARTKSNSTRDIVPPKPTQ